MDLVSSSKTARQDRDAVISELFAAHHRRLVGLAALLVDDKESAEDVVQEAFAAVYRRWRVLRDPESALAYLQSSVVNGSRSQLRRRRTVRERLPRLTPVSEELESAEQGAVRHEQEDLLWQAVCSLPPRQRQVLVLRYYLNQTEAEIASTLDVSRGSVKQHASRGLAELARRWEAGT